MADLNRQHDESGSNLRNLLDLVRSAQQREAQLQQELDQTQAALRTRVSEVEQLGAAVATLREQATSREQADKDEADVRKRLLQVERYIAELTVEKHQRDAAEQAQIDAQVRANESLRGELAGSWSRVQELEAMVLQLRTAQADLAQALADSQQQLAITGQRLADRDKAIQQLQRQHAQSSEADRRLISEGMAQRTALAADLQRLQQDHETQRVTSNRQLGEAAARLAEEVASRQSRDQEHSEVVTRLTSERNAAAQQFQALRALVRELVPFPIPTSGPFETHAARLKTHLKNPLAYFVEALDPTIAMSLAAFQKLMIIALLLAQGRIGAMMTLAAGESAAATSDVLVRQVIEAVRQYKDFYPEGVLEWAEGNEEMLHAIEKEVSNRVRQKLGESLRAASSG